jgi:hypothetical protein
VAFFLIPSKKIPRKLALCKTRRMSQTKHKKKTQKYEQSLLALPTTIKANDIVLRDIIEYSSFRDFDPYVIGLFLT